MNYKAIIIFLFLSMIFLNGCGLRNQNKINCSEGYYYLNKQCISQYGDNICTQDEKELCYKDCSIEELKPYPQELQSVFINSIFSDDCIIQEDEREILNKTFILFQYDSLNQVKNKLIEINGLGALLEILKEYNPYNTSENRYEKILDDYSISEEDKIYITNIAHMLWIEEKMPWSIKNYSEEDVYYLTEREKNNQWGSGIISKEYLKLFPLSFNFVSSDKEKTIKDIIEWEMKNFFHANEEYGWDVYNTTSDKSSLIPLKNIFSERVADCQITSNVLMGMLRSINIPAQRKNFKGHGAVFIPDLNLYVHGDYIADFTVAPDILMTKEKIESYVYSEEGYNKFWNENQHKYPKLKRKGNKLYVEGILQSEEAKSKENIKFIKESLKEYNLTFEETEVGGIKISSNFIEIKEL